jgi:hypothetical protein
MRILDKNSEPKSPNLLDAVSSLKLEVDLQSSTQQVSHFLDRASQQPETLSIKKIQKYILGGGCWLGALFFFLTGLFGGQIFSLLISLILFIVGFYFIKLR